MDISWLAAEIGPQKMLLASVVQCQRVVSLGHEESPPLKYERHLCRMSSAWGHNFIDTTLAKQQLTDDVKPINQSQLRTYSFVQTTFNDLLQCYNI